VKGGSEGITKEVKNKVKEVKEGSEGSERRK
jgi:hypothetical protein